MSKKDENGGLDTGSEFKSSEMDTEPEDDKKKNKEKAPESSLKTLYLFADGIDM